MVLMCKFVAWSILCAAPWFAFMTWNGFPWNDLAALAWSIPAGAWILVVSVGMRFKACKN